MNNFMLDLETLSTQTNAAILSIGVVAFDIKTRQIGSSFYELVDLDSSIASGGHISADTFCWWLMQSDDARQRLVHEDRADLARVLIQFGKYLALECEEAKTRYMWGNGAAFDNAILQSAYQRLSLPIPWEFYNDRCYRTIKNQYPQVPLIRVGTHHDPRDDAESQARHLISMLNPG